MSDTEKKLDFDYFWKSKVVNWDVKHDLEMQSLKVTCADLKIIIEQMFEYIEENLQERK